MAINLNKAISSFIGSLGQVRRELVNEPVNLLSHILYLLKNGTKLTIIFIGFLEVCSSSDDYKLSFPTAL